MLRQRRSGGRFSHATGNGALFESLEQRALMAATANFSSSVYYFNDIQASAAGGAGTSPQQNLTIKNTGNATLKITSIALGGSNPTEFTLSSTAAFSLNAGQSKTLGIKFNAKALGIRTSTLTIKTNDTAHATNSLKLRGLGTAGNGGNAEPSLQRILDLFQIPVKVGDDNPADTTFPVPPKSPNDEVVMQTLKKAGTGKVTVDLLAVFANFKSPATNVGYYTPGNSGATTQLFTVPLADAQSVHPSRSGTSTFDPGSNSFGIYTTFPAFSNRNAYSEDALNTWDSAKPRKVRFYPLKNSDGSKVSNAYVFVTEDYNKAYDFNDVVGIIRNVKSGSASSTGSGSDTTAPLVVTSTGNIAGLDEINKNTLPSNDRIVFNKISNPDPLRPNVTRDTSTLQLTNNSGSPITIDSLEIGDTSAFKIISGGGSNFTIDPGSTRNVQIQFIGAGSGSTIVKTYSVPLKINSGGSSDTIALQGLWQAYSEQTPSHKYCEPSLQVIINNVFGFKTTILNPGETTNHKGQPVAVGDEVQSAYWERADSGQSVKVRMLAAFHRQNNFDKVTGEPITAASNLFYYYKGNKSGHQRIIVHNENEGQCLLPHKSGSTSSWAEATFNPSSGKTFGFEVDKHFTDRTLNDLDFNPTTGEKYPGSGYAFRFFPLKDTNGNLVQDAYIMAGDNTANQYANWDYNDNIYIVYNVKPADAAAKSSVMSVAVNTGSPFQSSTKIGEVNDVLNPGIDSVLL